MKNKEYQFKMPSRRQPIFKIFKAIITPFFKAKTIINLNENLPEKAIVVSNHSAKKGPVAMELSYPCFNVKWGAHEMLGDYKSRYNYLRNVLYIQKLGKNKFAATIKATFEAFFSVFVYKGLKFIPTYTDMRFMNTLKYSMQVLDAGASVLIFPEDSSKGYFDEITAALPGFIMLAERYYKKTGEDVPVVPAYYYRKGSKVIIGKSLYVQDMVKEGLSTEQIAERFKDEINSLYRTYCVGENKD